MSLAELVQDKLDAGIPVAQIGRMYGVRLDRGVFKSKPRPPLVLIHSQDRVEAYDPGPDQIAEIAGLLPELGDASLRRVAALALSLVKDREGLGGMNRLIGAVQLAAAAKSVAPGDELTAIASDVAIRHGVTVRDLRGCSQKREFSWPRQEAYARARAVRNPDGGYRYSLVAIGRFFNRDHSTVKHGIDTYELRRAREVAQG